MDPQVMEPFGLALLSFFEGHSDAELIIRRDDGEELTLPASRFFREPSEFTQIEESALGLCKGHVLDVGAGAGIHSLFLQRKGSSVTAIDVDLQAAEILKRRGVKDVHRADIFAFEGGPYDTVLMLGHGIGMVETIAGLDRFLSRVERLLSEDGQVLLDSADVRSTDNPSHLAYHEANRGARRYIGEIRFQLEFQGIKGPLCGWLNVDPETLQEHAEKAGFQAAVIRQEQSGDYLARLTRQRAAQPRAPLDAAGRGGGY